MIEFLKSEYNISDIPIKEITVTHIENFYLYLREQCEVSNNTAMKFVQRFHTILLFAQKSGLSFLDPFNNFRFNFDKTDRGYLTQEEIDTIAATVKFTSGNVTGVNFASKQYKSNIRQKR